MTPWSDRQTVATAPDAAELAALQAHPRFDEAIRLAAHGLLAVYQGNRLLNTVVNDRGRLLIGYLCLYLHYSAQAGDPRSGLTVGRVKALCAEQQICSPGRVEGMLVLMRLFGYLAPASPTGDRRTRHLVPTERMIAAIHTRWRQMFTAISLVLPHGAEGIAALSRPDFTPALVLQLAARFLAGFRFLDSAPGLELFADRNAGMMILFSLIETAAPNDTVPPRQPVTLSLSSVSRRFGVSRAHVRNLLRDAADVGLIQRSSGADNSEYMVLAPLAEATRKFFATMFLVVAASIAAAIEEIDSTSAVTPQMSKSA